MGDIMRFRWFGLAKVKVQLSRESLHSGGAYQLKLECALSTRGAKCFLLLGNECAGGAGHVGLVAGKFVSCAGCNKSVSSLSFEKV